MIIGLVGWHSAKSGNVEAFRNYFTEIPLNESVDVRRVLPVLDYHTIPDSLLHRIIPIEKFRSQHYVNPYSLEASIMFRMSDQVDGYIMRYYNEDHFMFWRSHLLVMLDRRSGKFLDLTVIDVEYEEEGIHGQVKSFIHDFNLDGTLELVGMDFNLYNSESNKLWRWELAGTSLSKDTADLNDLFELTDTLFSGYEIIEKLSMETIVGAVEKRFVTGESIRDWSILLAETSSREEALLLKDRFDSAGIFSSRHAHYIGYWDCLLYQHNQKFYLVLNNGITLTQARLSLPKAVELFGVEAKVFKLSRICAKWVAEGGEIDYVCGD